MIHLIFIISIEHIFILHIFKFIIFSWIRLTFFLIVFVSVVDLSLLAYLLFIKHWLLPNILVLTIIRSLLGGFIPTLSWKGIFPSILTIRMKRFLCILLSIVTVENRSIFLVYYNLLTILCLLLVPKYWSAIYKRYFGINITN